MFAGALLAGGALGGAGWALWPPSMRDSTTTALPHTAAAGGVPLARPAAQEFTVISANEAQIRDNTVSGLTVYRLTSNPNILVLDFASLMEQGAMLNRLGAFAEKAGLPRDRVLTDAELDAAVRAGGDTPETYYYGHDYSAATLARFFALADRDRIALTPSEEALRRLMQQEGWFAEGKAGGLISVPRVGANERITAESRATILHHELSHGEYFSNAAYAAYTHHFWTSVLTARERDGVRQYLGSEEYDSQIDDLMENEAQAYLVFTLNPAFFTASMVGMTEARRAEVRAIFLRDQPSGWLRDQSDPLAEVVKAAAH